VWHGGSTKLDGYGHELVTIVNWTLTPDGNGGTNFHVEHFEGERFAFKAMGQGWRGKVAGRISEILATLSPGS
jgi:hypothetical protein